MYERNGGRGERDEGSYFEQRMASNTEIINAVARPIEKLAGFLKGKDRGTGFPRWIFAWLILSAASFEVAVGKDWLVPAVVLLGVFILGFMVLVCLSFTRR